MDVIILKKKPVQTVTLGNMSVHSFLKSHDAVEPCSFSVSSESRTMAVMTDIGLQCANVIDHIRNADAVFLESNYDDDMLRKGFYPPYLKKRPPMWGICPTRRPRCFPRITLLPGSGTFSCPIFLKTTTRRNLR